MPLSLIRRYNVYFAFCDGWAQVPDGYNWAQVPDGCNWAQVPDGWAQIIDDWAQAHSGQPLVTPLLSWIFFLLPAPFSNMLFS